jgi:hypothetical protein
MPSILEAATPLLQRLVRPQDVGDASGSRDTVSCGCRNLCNSAAAAVRERLAALPVATYQAGATAMLQKSASGCRGGRAGEGFTEVQYVTHEQSGGLYEGLTFGMADIGNDFAPMLIMHVDAGDPITNLGGVHVGCFELFGTERVRSIRDLKGKRVGVGGLGLPPHVFLASMVAYVGLDPGPLAPPLCLAAGLLPRRFLRHKAPQPCLALLPRAPRPLDLLPHDLLPHRGHRRLPLPQPRGHIVDNELRRVPPVPRALPHRAALVNPRVEGRFRDPEVVRCLCAI